jgi:hypothetical protein
MLIDWEPIPWDASPEIEVAQREGFELRASQRISWSKIDFQNLSAEGLFGQNRDWLVEHEVAYFAETASEQLLMIQGFWHGFPDPPEWGLISKAPEESRWHAWGHFAAWPETWTGKLE